jgi:aryl-alcohol dehydrogenase-like predicted oxidoreductase
MTCSHTIFPIGLGAMPLSLRGRPSESNAIEIIHYFIEQGGNLIDTADVYGLDDTDKGHNEKLISKALNQIGNATNNIIVATKGGATRPNGGWGLRGGHPKKLRKVCEQSLRNLNITEHALYYLHGPDPDIPLVDSVGELVLLKNEGKIKNIGLANITLNDLQLALTLTPIFAVQNRCNPFCKEDIKNGLIEFCRLNAIKYVPYCPFGGWAEHQQLNSSPFYRSLIEKYHSSSYLISLAWLLSKGEHIKPIPGMDRKEQIKINMKSLTLQLEQKDIHLIDSFPDLYSSIHVER